MSLAIRSILKLAGVQVGHKIVFKYSGAGYSRLNMNAPLRRMINDVAGDSQSLGSGADLETVAQGELNDVVGNHRSRVGVRKGAGAAGRTDVHSVPVRSVPAAAADNDVPGNQRIVQRAA